VDNPPTLNLAKAGSSVPIKFSLDGDQGLGVLASGYPQVELNACDADDLQVDAIEQTTTANNGLTYDPFTDTYTYVWKTSKGWRGQCATLTLKLDDNTNTRRCSSSSNRSPRPVADQSDGPWTGRVKARSRGYLTSRASACRGSLRADRSRPVLPSRCTTTCAPSGTQ
jgi:hypothetical protein